MKFCNYSTEWRNFTILLYHMLGTRGYKFIKQKIVPGGMEFYKLLRLM